MRIGGFMRSQLITNQLNAQWFHTDGRNRSGYSLFVIFIQIE